MALVRLDVPGLILCSGAMAIGSHRGKPVTIQDVWEAVGAHEAGQLTDEELAELERDACPGIGSCTGHFTANTMAVAVDFLGLGPAGLGGITATDPAKPAAAEQAGRLVLDVIARGARPSSFVTPRGIRERDRRRGGDRRLDELGAAPARDRRRGRCRARARRLRPSLGVDAGRDEPHAGRPVRRR